MTISWFSRVKYVDICWRTLELGWTRVNYGKTYHDISLINGNFHTLPLEPNGSMAPIELSDALGSSHPNVASAKCLDQIIRKWPGWVGYDGWHGTATKPWRHEKLNNLIINNSNTVIQCNTEDIFFVNAATCSLNARNWLLWDAATCHGCRLESQRIH